jgi:outer membrane protein assembly factor BamA
MMWSILFCMLILFGQAGLFGQASRTPLVRTWTIREVGNYKKIPTATLRAKMAQRGVLFGVNEPYDQNKVDGTVLLLSQVYKDAGVAVTVHPTTIPVGRNAVKVEYVVNKQ